MKRLTLLLLGAFVLFAGAPEAFAQTKSKVHVEIKDGRVFVNGEEVEYDGEPTITVDTEDGETITIRFSDEGNAVWVGDSDGDDWFGSPFKLRSGNMALKLEGMKGLHEKLADIESRGGAYSFFSDDGNTFAFSGDSPLERFYDVSSGFNTEVMAAERKLNEIARQLRMEDDEAARRELETELDQLLEEAFEAKLSAQRRQAAELEERLQELRSRLGERAEAKEDIIARKKEKLLGKKSVYDW